MKRILFIILSFAFALMAICDDELGVPYQLLMTEHDQLPDKTLLITFKELKSNEKFDIVQRNAIDSVLNLLTENASVCRTFIMSISEDDNGILTLNIQNFDPINAIGNQQSIMGVIVIRHCHVFIKEGNCDSKLTKNIYTITRHKRKYVREFEFVEEKVETPPTNIVATYDSGKIRYDKRIVDGIDLNDSIYE